MFRVLLAATLLVQGFSPAMRQNPTTPVAQGFSPDAPDCSAALAKGVSSSTAQVCLAEAEFERAQATARNSAAWSQALRTAAEYYKRAFGSPSDESIKVSILERLLRIFDRDMLNEPAEMAGAFQELISLKPTEVEPLFRFAKYQEASGSIESAEETLLTARRLRPGAIEPVQMLAQFYARRASELYVSEKKQEAREETPPAAADKNGVYQVGGTLAAPRRLGNPVFPEPAAAAGVAGIVVAEITVNESGTVTDARVLKSNPLLDEAALKAVREWRYDPTLVNGKPVPVKMTVTVNFTLGR